MGPDPSRKNGEVKNALSSKNLVKRATVFINSELYKVTCGMSDKRSGGGQNAINICASTEPLSILHILQISYSIFYHNLTIQQSLCGGNVKRGVEKRGVEKGTD